MRALLVAVLFAAGCAAHPVSGLTTIPKDTANECTTICTSIGLQLSAVVVVANQVGCVCDRSASPRAAGASAASGGAVIAADIAAREQQTRQHANTGP